MFLQEPRPTSYDLRFRIFNIPVVVNPLFWIVGLVIVGQVALTPTNLGGNPLVTLVACLVAWFVSILIHELGHSLVMAYYGIQSRICLYAMGGLAIPEAFGYRKGRSDKWQQVYISAAGPLAQIALYCLFAFCMIPLGYRVTVSASFPWVTIPFPIGGVAAKEAFLGITLIKFSYAFWFINWMLALFNLLPIFPLDGGQITKELMEKNYGPKGFEYTLWITLATCVFVALMLFQYGHQMGGIIVAILGFQAFQMLQGSRGGFYR